ncbi:hypothetical protein FB451DRAFT_1364887 [Mycena latifolia]|nr:hypothetical protein FB451DRAFT_1364887 [Mycena latifolia]
MFASLFYILCAKGFSSSSNSACGPSPPHGHPTSPEDPIPASSATSSRASPPAHNHYAVGNQPPSPPPEPGLSGSMDKAPRRIWWLFWVLLLIVAFLGFAGIYIYFATRNSLADLVVVVSPWIQHLSVLESGSFWWFHAAVLWISVFKLHIFLHGLHYCKILLLALASHSGFFSIHGRLSRLCSFMANRTCAIFFHYNGVVFLGSACLLASISPLNWVFYAYGSVLAGVFITPLLYLWNYLLAIDALYSLWSSFSLAERSVILGPSILHLAILSVWTVIRGLLGVPSFIRALRRQAVCIHRRPSLVIYFLLGCPYFALAATASCLPLIHWRIFIEATNPALRCPYSYFSGRWVCAAEEMWSKYRNMRPIYIELGRKFALALLGTAKAVFDSWCILGYIPKLLIMAPVVGYYGHLHIVSVAFTDLRVLGLCRSPIDSSRSQASGVNPELAASLVDYVLFFRPHASVENRLVVRGAAAIGDQKKRSKRRSQQ